MVTSLGNIFIKQQHDATSKKWILIVFLAHALFIILTSLRLDAAGSYMGTAALNDALHSINNFFEVLPESDRHIFSKALSLIALVTDLPFHKLYLSAILIWLAVGVFNAFFQYISIKSIIVTNSLTMSVLCIITLSVAHFESRRIRYIEVMGQLMKEYAASIDIKNQTELEQAYSSVINNGELMLNQFTLESYAILSVFVILMACSFFCLLKAMIEMPIVRSVTNSINNTPLPVLLGGAVLLMGFQLYFFISFIYPSSHEITSGQLISSVWSQVGLPSSSPDYIEAVMQCVAGYKRTLIGEAGVMAIVSLSLPISIFAMSNVLGKLKTHR